ncbi:glycosyltransferase [Candidatus Woesearchaeota archaeon]|nr:glycosyltransferase [Candidatus Woesearchaeota archaeon]
MKYLKIIHISKYYLPHRGGIETTIKSLYNMQKGKHDVKIITTKTNGTKSENDIIRLPVFAKFFSTLIYPSIIKELNKLDVDILHLHFPDPFLAFAFCLSRPKYKKLIISYHSDIVKQKGLYFIVRPFINHVLRKASAILVSNPNMLKSSQLKCINTEKLHVVPYGIDIPVLDKTKPLLDFKKPIILFVGRLVYYKGLDILLKAVKGLDATTLIVGNGPLKNKLMHLADKKVKFRDDVDDLTPYYQACDIFVLPSVEPSEAFGMVQLEAMAHGKPIISTSLGTGTDFVNKDMETGLVVEPRNVKQLRTAIKQLLTHPELRTRFGRNARKRYEEMFTATRFNNNVLEFY